MRFAEKFPPSQQRKICGSSENINISFWGLNESSVIHVTRHRNIRHFQASINISNHQMTERETSFVAG
jgi:hypothetical protein